MDKIEKLLNSYKIDPTNEKLHKLRIAIRKKLAKLEKKGKTNKILKKILKKSNKLRDLDVLYEKCTNTEVKIYIQNKRQKQKSKFLKFLNTIRFDKSLTKIKTKKISKKKCLKNLEKNFLTLSDEELHKIRLMIKKCRYLLKDKNLKQKLKTLQEFLGNSRDCQNCIKLLQKHHLETNNILNEKNECLKNANELRIEILKEYERLK